MHLQYTFNYYLHLFYNCLEPGLRHFWLHKSHQNIACKQQVSFSAAFICKIATINLLNYSLAVENCLLQDGSEQCE